MQGAFQRIDDDRLPEFYLLHDQRIMQSDLMDDMIASRRLRLRELSSDDEFGARTAVIYAIK